jgi:hypothetical protein
MAKKQSSLFFYHSFPRQRNQKLALGILKSILEKGLLLTAEIQELPACEGLRAKKYIQRRVCFTALSPDRLRGHVRKFGIFSLEFDTKALRQFGALPALYLSGRLPNGALFNNAGNEVARHLLATHDCLKRLWDLNDKGNQNERRLAREILARIKPEDRLIQHYYFTLQILLNLYYPTDDPRRTGPLDYYEQREWKIIPNFSEDGRTWHYDELTSQQKKELLALNPDFYGRRLLRQRRVDLCFFFSSVAGRNVVASARRIIVPDKLIPKVIAIMKETQSNIPVVGIGSLPR